MDRTADDRWITGNPEIDEWTASQHADGKHSPNCPPDCHANRANGRSNGQHPPHDDSQQTSGDASTNGHKPRYRLTPASAINPRPVTWLWRPDGHGRIPAGVITLGAGREGTGKSSFAAWQTAQTTRGTLPGAIHGTPRCVIYMAAEDAWEFTIVPRLIAAGADLDQVFRLDVYDDHGDETTLTLPTDNRALTDAIREVHAALVIFDPLMSSIHDKINPDRERELRRALDPLAAIAETTRAAVLGVAHFNKKTGADVLSRITGSGAFKHVARAVLAFAEDDDTRVMSQVKNSLGRTDLPNLTYRMEPVTVPTPEGPAETVRFTLTGESDRSVRDVLADGESSDDDQDVTSACADWLRAFMEGQGGQCDAGEANRAGTKAGFSQSSMKRARKRIGAKTAKGGMDKGWTWTIDQ